MATLAQHKLILAKLRERVQNGKPNFEQLETYFSEAVFILEDCPEEASLAFKVSNYTKEWCKRLYMETVDQKYWDMYWDIVLFEAPFLFDSYMIYLERNREAKDRFYLPRRKCFQKIGIIQAMQDLEDDKLDTLTLSLPPGTGKTTLEKFFATWIIGRYPEDYSLFFSHSGDITRMFYDGILDITTSSEYTFSEIFPLVKLHSTDARRECINFGLYKPFASIQCTSVGAKNAGKVRCNRYLYCDDLIGGIEEALNKNTLDKLWRIYGTDARQRKLNDQVKEIHIATRWSVHDVIGRLQQAKIDDPRAKFIAVPDIDPKTKKSNFMYDRNGLSTKFFKDQEKMMDEISYQCLYKNQPIEREGLLYAKDEVRRYMELPSGEPDAILGICDTKNKGTDYFFLPCFYQYGGDYYLVDCICNNDSNYGRQYERAAKLILQHKMQQCEFESNNGGNRVSYEVAKMVKEHGGRCNITDKPTTSNKETKIIVNADWVKKNVLFKDESLYTPRSEYGVMMTQLFSYSVVGKNRWDDIPDGLAMFALYVTRFGNVAKATAVHNPFRRY